jgi:SAM-dependent methyltransferase
MTQAASAQIETRRVLRCAACDVEGRNVLRDCRDYLCGLPGEWSFSQCPNCHSLWLDPAPVESAISSLYPENYRFTRSSDFHPSSFPSGIPGSAKLSILERRYKYDGLEQKADRRVGVALGRVFGALFVAKAGHSVRFLEKRERGNLLDAGCGNGDFMAWMQHLGWEVEGIELDPIAARIAIDRGLRVTIANIQTVDLPAAHFDAITLSHVAEHCPDPLSVFRKLALAVKKGGVLVSLSPNPGGISRHLFNSRWYALDPPRHFFLPSERAYRLMLERLGFEVKTWTSMRLFRWYFRESVSVAKSKKVGAVSDSFVLRFATAALTAIFSIWPGIGEEVVCYAIKR